MTVEQFFYFIGSRLLKYWGYIVALWSLPTKIKDLDEKLAKINQGPAADSLIRPCPGCRNAMTFKSSIPHEDGFKRTIANKFWLYYRCEKSFCLFKSDVPYFYEPK